MGCTIEMIGGLCDGHGAGAMWWDVRWSVWWCDILIVCWYLDYMEGMMWWTGQSRYVMMWYLTEMPVRFFDVYVEWSMWYLY